MARFLTSHLDVGSLITEVFCKVISYNYFVFKSPWFVCFEVDVLFCVPRSLLGNHLLNTIFSNFLTKEFLPKGE